MNYEEFCAALQEELFNRLDTSCSIHRERVLKNNGVVLDVYNDAMLGMVVEIDHGGKLVAKYCGLDSVSVSKGGSVKSGQEIGKLGSVPFEASLESHLHFETKLDGEYVDPLTVMGKTE